MTKDISISALRDSEFNIERLLVQHGLWNKVERHEDIERCPLCEKKFEEGDLAEFCLGKMIHKHCIEKLENEMQKMKENEAEK